MLNWQKLEELFPNPEALGRFVTKMEREHPLLARKLVAHAEKCAGDGQSSGPDNR